MPRSRPPPLASEPTAELLRADSVLSPLVAGAAAAQLCGTDKWPTVAALPRPADTADDTGPPPRVPPRLPPRRGRAAAASAPLLAAAGIPPSQSFIKWS